MFFLHALATNAQLRVDEGKSVVLMSTGSFFTIGSQLVSNNTKYAKVVTGSPYFRDSWMRGMVILTKGAAYDSILFRLDLLDNSLHYLDPRGTELIATSPVKTVILTDSVTGMKYTFDNSAYIPATNKIETGWYLLLADGQTALYKRIKRVLNETLPYGSATTEQTIDGSEEYYIFSASVFTRIKKIKEIPELLTDKKEALNKYISSKKLTGRSDTDYSELVEYYNTLLEKRTSH